MSQDAQQREVADRDVSARQLVLAGPGTGKTQTVALRLSHLLSSGIGPAQFLVLSFSRSAVRTVMERLDCFSANSDKVLEDLRHIAIRTFDAWSFRLLRQLGEQPQDILSLSHDGTIDHLVALITGERRDDIRERLSGIRHIIIDEFQDLSGVRARLTLALLELLAPPADQRVGFTMLGDEAQAIYGFALRNQTEQGLPGLTTSELLHALRQQYGNTLIEITLENNHRAVPGLAHISRMLRQLLCRHTTGVIKLDTMRGMFLAIPEAERPLDRNFIREVDNDSTAILTRTNGEAVRVWQQIMGTECEAPAFCVLLHGANTNTMVPAWVAATLGPVQGNTLSRQRFARVYQHLYGDDGAQRAKAVGIPDQTTAWHRLLRAAQLPDSAVTLDLDRLRSRIGWPDLFPDDQGERDCPLSIMTVHQSKGREFSHVLLLHSRRSASLPPTEAEILEEANVLFVGISRAGKTLRRISSESLKPLRSWRLANGRRHRWVQRVKHSSHEMEFQIEIGVSGDLSATSFIDARLHESESAVAAVQTLLMENPAALAGRKVMLCQRREPGAAHNRLVFALHLDDNGDPGLLLGATAPMLTFDLREILTRRHHLPKRIRNLRITDVVTCARRGDETTGLTPPWSTSGFWLGVNIYGIGEFVPRDRRIGPLILTGR